jgi:hypothetical protein
MRTTLPSKDRSGEKKEEEQKHHRQEKSHKLIKRQIDAATDDTRHHCHDSSGMHMFLMLRIIFVDQFIFLIKLCDKIYIHIYVYIHQVSLV